MRSVSFIATLLFTFFTLSFAAPDFIPILESRKNNNGTSAKGNSVNKACRTMAKLEGLTKLAANTTKLDALVTKGKLNQTEVDAIKAKAANATSELATMTSNTTLVSECAVVSAHEKVVGECKAMKSLTKLAALANNQTAMDAFMAKHNITAAKMTKLEEKIGNASTKLQTLMSNTTLTDLCTAEANQQKGKS
jgi:nitrate reductase alpha subunit